MKRLYQEGLFSSVVEKNVFLAKKFLDLGADPDSAGPNACFGCPPLMAAADRKDADMVKLLVEHGAKAALHLSTVQDLLHRGR